jgi:hypothetical protein
MAITAQPDHGLRSQERLKDGIQLAGGVEFFTIIACQDDLQGLGIAEDNSRRHFLAQVHCETISVPIVAAAHVRKRLRYPVDQPQEFR